MLVGFTEMVSSLILCLAPYKGPDETCYIAKSYLELLYIKSIHSNKQMTDWMPGTGLPSLKKLIKKHYPTIQDKFSS